MPFYRYDWIFEDFDDHGTPQNWNWGTDIRGAWWEPASFTVTPASGNWIGFENYTGWWDHNVQFNGTLNAGYDLTYTYGTDAGKKFQLANVKDVN